ncbi:AP2-associated protein kinase 1 isoform X1 [Cryptotermes secundus]|uniref:AP2-associated protein kinase 1 isoform X1 n=1 Tax=Cryptotermes secundus TaxID=105785 RepID=UPI000CD7CCCF|nr:AP2-associated protein kinase 1 isoform X1 [Cryptotermes secundus]
MCLRKSGFVVLVLVTTSWGQQFNSSPIQSLAQHQVTSSQNAKRSGNQKQESQIVPTEQNQLSSREMIPFGSVQTFQHSRENNGDVQQRYKQPVQFKIRNGTVSRTTIRNAVNDPVPATLGHQRADEQHTVQQTQNFQKISIQRPALKPSNQTSPTVSFQTSQVGLQSLSSPSAQQEVPLYIQPFSLAHQQAVQNTNQGTILTKSTSVPQTAKQAKELQSNELNRHVQQPVSPLHQPHLPQRTTFVHTFPTQRSSTQIQPLQQQQIPGNRFPSQTQNVQHETVHGIKAPQLQQQQKPQKKVVQNQQRVGQTALSSQEELFQKQARNAKYSFNSAINDNIMDNTQIRQEERNGLELFGYYSYSDGFYKRTVHYKADEHGYRVTKEEIEPIGNGPQVNLEGDAVVNTNIAGVNNKYSITTADIH